MKYTTKFVSELTPSEYRQLVNLNFRDQGSMRDKLKSTRLQSQIENHPDARARVVLALDENKVMGWALIFAWYNKEREKPYSRNFVERVTQWNTYLYVRKSYRRQGIGQNLMKHVYATQIDAQVHPHDQASGYFFYRMKQEMPKLDCWVDPERYIIERAA